MDLLDKSICPTIEEIREYVKKPVFMQFYSEIKDTYQCSEKIEYSSCSCSIAAALVQAVTVTFSD